jgi:hypothetical protein
MNLASLGWPGLATHPWAYPALEAAHVFGIALLVGNLVALELRVWGLARALPLVELGRLCLTLSLAGFGVVALTGLAMFGSQPAELLANRAFTVKLGLITLAGINAAFFHARGGLRRPDGLARLLTVVSLGLWLAVIICGRWIAYR